MIVIYHQNNKVVEVEHKGKLISFSETNIASVLFEMAEIYSDNLIVWCQLDLKTNLNLSNLKGIYHHQKILASYDASENSFISESIGYVEGSPFLKINKEVSYPTWQMSSCVGGIYASVLVTLKEELKADRNFDYFLNSMAKLAMEIGLFCYSEPKLVKDFSGTIKKHAKSNFLLFRFVKQHYKTRWVFLLFLNLFLYEKRISLLPLIFSLFYFKRKLRKNSLDKIEVQSINKVVETGTLDVIIPTIGRKQYLYDVLKDLSVQTQLPKNVIIVEQNPQPGSISELNYITDENWPFKIKHTFTHQAGACNARNLALEQVESEWVFLNDDDNRFEADLIESVLKRARLYGVNCLTTSYITKDEILKYKTIHQSGIFGSGNSFLKTDFLKFVSFNKSLEFGYGEDTDFGLQLRNLGVDIIYFPELVILHLKAPMGGFRCKFVFPWELEGDFPKPSPNIMYVKSRHFTKQHLLGYKTILFFKLHKINFFALSEFNNRWQSSIKWSKKI